MREVRLLGTPEVTDTGTSVPRFRSLRTAVLLGYLAAERRTITRERLAAFFWPDEPVNKGKANLRRELHNLGRVLPGCWEIDRVQVRFTPTLETLVDIDELQRLEKEEAWQEAADLLRGDFLEGITLDHNLEFETWLLGEQERWRQQAERILSRAIEEFERQGAYRRALRHARTLLRFMPWSEETHRLVMRFLALSGQRSAALKQYETCRNVLWEELGVEPLADTMALYERIRQSPHFTNDNIPAATSPIIGRDRELADITAMLTEPEIRLITITGLGGIGKTRLALEAARQHTYGQFRDGVVFVPLASLETEEQVVPAIARALHLPLTPDDERQPRDQLLNFLKTRQILLVLDNVEQLRDSLDLLREILRVSTGTRILTTSRRPLRLSDEHQYALKGLVYAEESIEHAAAEFFTHAAQRVSHDFQISENNMQQINQLCRMVDGMPLALELAAGWVDTLSLTAVIKEIENNLDFLAVSQAHLPDRHRSIEALFDGTWRQLHPETRHVFAALSLFPGSFTQDAARAVAGAVPRLLADLVSHSLIQFDLDRERYQLHELLRQYAAERLASDEQKNLRRRHLGYYAQAAQIANRNSRPANRKETFALWEADFNNIEAALDWSLKDAASRVDGIALATSLEEFWLDSKGQMRQGYLWLKSLADSNLDVVAPAGRAQLWRALGRMEGLRGHNNAAAQTHCEASLELYEETGDRSECARTLFHLGDLLLDWNKLSDAESAFKEALDIAVEVGDIQVQSAAKFGLSNLARLNQQLDQAQDLAQESLALARQTDDRMRTANALATMGLIATEQQRLADARALFLDAFAKYQDIGSWGSLHVVFNSLGEIARIRGDDEEAVESYLKSLQHAKRQGVALDILIALFNLSQAELMCGDVRQAHAHISEGWEMARPYPGEMKALYMEAIANLAASQGRPYVAALLWGASETLFESYGVHPDSADELQRDYFCAIARSQSIEEKFAYAWSGGRRLSLDQAVKLAQHTVSTSSLLQT